jgi:UDP-4-amino-4,6-dideoxy-N-acetyl-beta-L-altrosamine transaminase
MSLPFLPYAKQSIQYSDCQAVLKALKGNIITRGPIVEAFEKAIAEYCGARYAVAFSNGTAALLGACFAAEISPFDRVVSTPNTFIATVGSAIHFGASPRFIDIDRSTGNMSLKKLKDNLDFQSTRGRLVIIPVHFGGIAIDMQALDQLMTQPNTVIIEDAAHALGSYYPTGKRVGCCAWSQMTVFSFHPAKTITTGEGGMVTTNDPHLYHRLQLYRNNGIEREEPYLETTGYPGYYEVHYLTGNFHLTDFQAALGLSQLQRLDKLITKRRQLVKVYRHALKEIPDITLMMDAWDDQTAFHLFVVQINFSKYQTSREAVMKALKEKGIGTQVHYIPLYRHPAIKQLCGDLSEQYPEMEAYYTQALSLPLYYDLTEKDVQRICQEFKKCLNALTIS